ncbi:potassium channel family protein [Psychroflexus maritimus]|uniref:Two pore domain potassium channel family protein n=1 Tax=Psychroflexus maritimus TaxID=2714865 RepID=A0A967ABV6_9FLAO|nr:potassium channel family protein [Psychroflexus maritimus]NGZ88748.1 two pore domain potassium channel family protein [Psychroflexus maritimus]
MINKLLVLLFSLLGIVILIYSFFLPTDSEIYRLLWYYDFILCLYFLFDFLKQFFESKNKFRFFFTVGWLDLLSAVPVMYQFRFFRIFRIVRIIRILNSITSLASILDFVKSKPKQSFFGFIIFFIVSSLLITSVGVLYLEQEVGNITTAEDCLWWAMVTISTVGYGDLYPVTNLGRFLAMILIFTGVVSFGALLSYINGRLNSFKN